MMTGGSAFLDTNILLRATLPAMPLHQEAATLVAAQRAQGTALWISRQVIREYIAIATRPQTFVTPFSATEIAEQIRRFERLFIVADDTAEVTSHLLALLRKYPTGGKQIHDANIVATMLTYGVPTLLTHNIDDMHRFNREITIVPLHASAS